VSYLFSFFFFWRALLAVALAFMQWDSMLMPVSLIINDATNCNRSGTLYVKGNAVLTAQTITYM